MVTFSKVVALRELGVQRMQLMGTPRRLPSITAGFGLEIAGYIARPQQP